MRPSLYGQQRPEYETCLLREGRVDDIAAAATAHHAVVTSALDLEQYGSRIWHS